MSCSPYDLRDFLFDELTAPQQGEVRAHLKTCSPCTTELESLRSTQAALLTIHDEEMPQRIGFVSDKVFEPSPVRRWVSSLWTSAARLGFVSAALLSAAILVHAVRPAQEVHNPAQSAFTQADLDRRIDAAVSAQVSAQLQAKVDAAVTQAVAETEQRAQKRTTTLLAAAEKSLELQRWALNVQADQTRYNHMKGNAAVVKANYGAASNEPPQTSKSIPFRDLVGQAFSLPAGFPSG